MKYKILLISIIFAGILSGCKYGTTFKNVQFPGDFSIEYPPYLKRSHGIHPSALLQSGNKYRDVYFIAGTFPKGNDSTGFNIFTDTTLNNLKINLEDPYVETDTTFVKDNMLARKIILSGAISEHRMLYVIYFYKGKKKNFQTTGWIFKSKKDLWMNDLEKAGSSLKEL